MGTIVPGIPGLAGVYIVEVIEKPTKTVILSV